MTHAKTRLTVGRLIPSVLSIGLYQLFFQYPGPQSFFSSVGWTGSHFACRISCDQCPWALSLTMSPSISKFSGCQNCVFPWRTPMPKCSTHGIAMVRKLFVFPNTARHTSHIFQLPYHKLAYCSTSYGRYHSSYWPHPCVCCDNAIVDFKTMLFRIAPLAPFIKQWWEYQPHKIDKG